MKKYLCLILCFTLTYLPVSAVEPESPENFQPFMRDLITKFQSAKTFQNLSKRNSSHLSESDKADFERLILKYGLKELPEMSFDGTFIVVTIDNQKIKADFRELQKGRFKINGKIVVMIKGQSFKVTADSILRILNKSDKWEWSDILFPKAHAFYLIIAGVLVLAAMAAAYKMGLLSPILSGAEDDCNEAKEKLAKETEPSRWIKWTKEDRKKLDDAKATFSWECYCDPNWKQPPPNPMSTVIPGSNRNLRGCGKVDPETCAWATKIRDCFSSIGQVPNKSYPSTTPGPAGSKSGVR